MEVAGWEVAAEVTGVEEGGVRRYGGTGEHREGGKGRAGREGRTGGGEAAAAAVTSQSSYLQSTPKITPVLRITRGTEVVWLQREEKHAPRSHGMAMGDVHADINAELPTKTPIYAVIQWGKMDSDLLAEQRATAAAAVVAVVVAEMKEKRKGNWKDEQKVAVTELKGRHSRHSNCRIQHLTRHLRESERACGGSGGGSGGGDAGHGEGEKGRERMCSGGGVGRGVSLGR
ncbi:hypothetical protein O3P69_017607 [Scylla paramamosain]|uniref:Uncharacterized protein n=1 Tax=Scylla paramamosain TaxID=85552 RepID=A0AAW0TYD3_SCYPA